MCICAFLSNFHPALVLPPPHLIDIYVENYWNQLSDSDGDFTECSEYSESNLSDGHYTMCACEIICINYMHLVKVVLGGSIVVIQSCNGRSPPSPCSFTLYRADYANTQLAAIS